MSPENRVAGSFRDPSGFLFIEQGRLFRQVNQSYQSHFEQLNDSGLYEELCEEGLLVPHTIEDLSLARTEDAIAILAPSPLPFISYPSEWSFSQLKAAALLTLDVQKRAMQKGMILKDATAYNVQFIGSRPVFIDTLSFEGMVSGEPWVAYRQFCQHFLAPLLLTSRNDERLSELFQTNLDGIPLDLAAKLLPGSTRLRPSVYTHIVLHSRMQRRFADSSAQSTAPRKRQISELGLRGLIDNLESVVQNTDWRHPKSEWGEYYDATNYDMHAMGGKEAIVDGFLRKIESVHRVVDAGANTGHFSAIAARYASSVIALDVDWVAVDKHYIGLRSTKDETVLPLRVDLTAPTPAFGWANSERESFINRCGSSTVMALALIHHLAISNNVPLESVAEFFSIFANELIIEFVPKSDSQVMRLLSTREDIFPHYTIDGFESAFRRFFTIEDRKPVPGSERVVYLMQKRH